MDEVAWGTLRATTATSVSGEGSRALSVKCERQETRGRMRRRALHAVALTRRGSGESMASDDLELLRST